jgi:hypothetical protein
MEWEGNEGDDSDPAWSCIQSLQGGSPAQRPIFSHIIEQTGTLLEFYLYARYKSHNDATLS